MNAAETTNRRGGLLNEPRVGILERLDIINGLLNAASQDAASAIARACSRDRTHSQTWFESIIKTEPVGPAFLPTRLSAEGLGRPAHSLGSSMMERMRASLLWSIATSAPTFICSKKSSQTLQQRPHANEVGQEAHLEMVEPLGDGFAGQASDLLVRVSEPGGKERRQDSDY